MARVTKKRKPSSKKPARKASAKKTAKKKATTARKPLRKKAAAKKAVKKAARKTAAKSARKKAAARKRTPAASAAALVKEAPEIMPGPPPIDVPPVEEPAQYEQAIGVVTHYYSHLGVAVVQINAGKLRVNDLIKIKGHTTNFTQTVQSMEYEHQHVDEAVAGQAVGLKLVDHAREHDIVYRE